MLNDTGGEWITLEGNYIGAELIILNVNRRIIYIGGELIILDRNYLY